MSKPVTSTSVVVALEVALHCASRRPTERRERPQGRREPGVEHVRVACAAHLAVVRRAPRPPRPPFRRRTLCRRDEHAGSMATRSGATRTTLDVAHPFEERRFHCLGTNTVARSRPRGSAPWRALGVDEHWSVTTARDHARAVACGTGGCWARCGRSARGVEVGDHTLRAANRSSPR